jgi:hypothetical protein
MGEDVETDEPEQTGQPAEWLRALAEDIARLRLEHGLPPVEGEVRE